jgi:RNA polymerase sigma-70 factor (ECF subfamily)
MEDVESVIQQMCSGDSGAFDIIFRRFDRAVYRTAFLITSDKEIAGEVMQEVFISVWKYRKTYNPEKSTFATWLQRITVNQCNRKLANAKNAALSIEKLEDADNIIAAGSMSNPEEVIVTREEYERLLSALNELDIPHRTVIVLRFFNDLSYKEIADAVDIPIGTVKSRLNNALKQIKQLYFRGGWGCEL